MRNLARLMRRKNEELFGTLMFTGCSNEELKKKAAAIGIPRSVFTKKLTLGRRKVIANALSYGLRKDKITVEQCIRMSERWL